MTTDVFALLEAPTAGRPDSLLHVSETQVLLADQKHRKPNKSLFSLHLMIPYHKLLQYTRWEVNLNDLCIAALTNPRAACLKLSSASTHERLSVESCMLRMCRQHTDLRGSGPILVSSKTTSNFWIFCILAKPAARPRAAFIASAQRRAGLQPKAAQKVVSWKQGSSLSPRPSENSARRTTLEPSSCCDPCVSPLGGSSA